MCIFKTVHVCTCAAPHQCLLDRSLFRVRPWSAKANVALFLTHSFTFTPYYGLPSTTSLPSVSNYISLLLIYLSLSVSDTPFAFPSPLLSLNCLGRREGHFSSWVSGEMLCTHDKWRHSDWIINNAFTLPLDLTPFLLLALCYLYLFVAHIVTW